MFDELFPRVFASTVEIARLGPEIAYGPPMDFVIEPSIDAFEFRTSGLESDSPEFLVRYRFNLYTPSAVPVASWTITGDLGTPGTTEEYEHVGANMRIAAERFLAFFSPSTGNGTTDFTEIIAKLHRQEMIPPPRADQALFHVKRIMDPLQAIMDPESQKRVFGGSIEETGLIALNIRIDEAVPADAEIELWAARLLLQSGQLVPPASPSQVVDLLDQPGVSAAEFILSPPFGTVIALGAETSETDKRGALRKALENAQIEPRTTSTEQPREGMLYFAPKVSGDAPDIESARLRLWFSRDQTSAYVVEQLVDLSPPQAGEMVEETRVPDPDTESSHSKPLHEEDTLKEKCRKSYERYGFGLRNVNCRALLRD